MKKLLTEMEKNSKQKRRDPCLRDDVLIICNLIKNKLFDTVVLPRYFADENPALHYFNS